MGQTGVFERPILATGPHVRHPSCRLSTSSSPLGPLHLNHRLTYFTIVPLPLFCLSPHRYPLRMCSVLTLPICVCCCLSLSPFPSLLPFSAHLYSYPLISLPVSYMNECALGFVERFIQFICFPGIHPAMVANLRPLPSFVSLFPSLLLLTVLSFGAHCAFLLSLAMSSFGNLPLSWEWWTKLSPSCGKVYKPVIRLCLINYWRLSP